MKAQYDCYVIVSADRATLDPILGAFDLSVLRPAAEVNLDDRAGVIVYSFESDFAIDVERLAEASSNWRSAKIEAVWITKEQEVGLAAVEAGAIVDFLPLRKFMLIELLYASLAMRR